MRGIKWRHGQCKLAAVWWSVGRGSLLCVPIAKKWIHEDYKLCLSTWSILKIDWFNEIKSPSWTSQFFAIAMATKIMILVGKCLYNSRAWG